MAVAPSKHSVVFEAYVRIKRRSSAENRLKELREKRVSYRANLHDISQQLSGQRSSKDKPERLQKSMMKLRSRLTACLQEISRLEQSPENDLSVSMSQLRVEFDQICSNPYLLEVSLTIEETIKLVIGARYVYYGLLYDLGDWMIIIGNQNHRQEMAIAYNVIERRSGTLREWGGGPPAYRQSEHVFCLGDGSDSVELYVNQRDYVAALEVITFSLCNVNEDDIHNVPLAFKQIA